jgi:hypothetical protein
MLEGIVRSHAALDFKPRRPAITGPELHLLIPWDKLARSVLFPHPSLGSDPARECLPPIRRVFAGSSSIRVVLVVCEQPMFLCFPIGERRETTIARV